jgi:hypothetical protein
VFNPDNHHFGKCVEVRKAKSTAVRLMKTVIAVLLCDKKSAWMNLGSVKIQAIVYRITIRYG